MSLSTCETTSRIGVLGRPLLAQTHDRTIVRLVVLMGDEQGRRYTLERGGDSLVGRSGDCEVRLADTKISRKHARIRYEDSMWFLEDLDSRNGTLLNGIPTRHHVLSMGDRIQLSGDTLLLFTRSDPLEDLVVHRQQMEVIGQLAAGIAHDFNNLLNVIAASTAHLKALPKDTPLDFEDVPECRADIEEAAMRAGQLTKKLLAVARRREQRLAGKMLQHDVDMSHICEDVLHLIERTFDGKIKFRSSIQADLIVRGDHASLHRMLMNLCFNARDAMEDGGTISILARGDVSKEDDPRSPFVETPQVVIEVMDTGCGMDATTRERAFEPFYTTKEKGAGSGLGLATVYEVATSHGGWADVESIVEKGSHFTIRLPAVTGAREEEPYRKKPRIQTWDHNVREVKKNGHLMIVDDHELVRKSLGRLVRAQGHTVDFAEDGAQAVELYRTSEIPFDVILLDLDMPKVSGDECLAALLEYDPNARAVFITGYYDEPRKDAMLALGACDFLSKPIDAESLYRAIGLALQIPAVRIV